MGIIRKTLKLTTISATAGLGAFFVATRNSSFVALDPAKDPIFSSKPFRKLNPEANPTTHDLCVRRVPLTDINPVLLEKKGRLVEAFCAGVWSGWGIFSLSFSPIICTGIANDENEGYAAQRAYFARKYESPETAKHLWSREDLRASNYSRGTLITDHFEVLDKSNERIVVRCGDSPRNRNVRPSDGLFEMSAVVKPDEGVAEFGLKSVFFQGLGKAESPPMPFHIVWLHKQYTKLWAETAIRNVLR